MSFSDKIAANFTGLKDPTHQFCAFCSYSTSHEGNLKIHLMAHTGEKLHACSQCDYRCNRKYDLKRHMRIHTGERPFTCLYCDHRFSQKYNLRMHIMLKHT